MTEAYVASGNITTRYLGRIIRVYTEDTTAGEGKVISFEYAERSPGVRIVIFNSQGILLNKEWRLEHKSFDFRLPGGKVFDKIDDYLSCKKQHQNIPGKIIRDAAARELREEADLSIDPSELTEVHISKCGATIVWDLHYLQHELLQEPKLKKRIKTDEGEVTEPTWVSWSDAIDFCLSGKINEDRSVAVILKKALTIEHLKK